MKKKQKEADEDQPKPEKAEDAKKEDKPATTNTEESTAFDFGGIPDRDLKKNLGCG